MTTIIGVRFRSVGKIYYFAPGDFEIKQGDKVIVETARGVELGNVLIAPRQVEDESVVQPLKAVIRIATEEDVKTVEENIQKEKEAVKICKQKIAKHELDMKLIAAEYTFDRKRLLFYFTSEGRVDFRELVKDLASEFRTRIELRQIGVRDETKMLGGIGICGRELCCKTYLSDFAPVSIKMAKEQNLSLNTSKISGVCGRLMCCLNNEAETYEYLNCNCPKVGCPCVTPDGENGLVRQVNVLRQTAKVEIEHDDMKEIEEFSVSELEFQKKEKKPNTEKAKAPEKETKEPEANNEEKTNKKSKNKKNKKRNNKEN